MNETKPLEEREIREGNMESGATFSLCRKYRYTLWRVWNPTQSALLFIGLNPSTADAFLPDPTVSRMRIRAEEYGFGGLIVCNIFAIRSKHRSVMRSAEDPIGPENERAIWTSTMKASMVLCGWGTDGAHMDRGNILLQKLRLMEPPINLQCLGQTKTGHPMHPLYIPYKEKPRPIK